MSDGDLERLRRLLKRAGIDRDQLSDQRLVEGAERLMSWVHADSDADAERRLPPTDDREDTRSAEEPDEPPASRPPGS